MKNHKFQKGQKLGAWELIRFHKNGGNGAIWFAKNDAGDSAVIKILKFKKPNQVAYKRFCDEVKIVVSLKGMKGVLPIIDYELPEDYATSPPWYVMPIAEPLTKILGSASATEIVNAIMSIAETLTELHDKEISHRDIKPANLFRLKGQWCLGDFGLVDYPEKEDITPNHSKVGAKWTIAPEMRRNPVNADGKLADTYSLAKTLWILLCRNKMCFDGQYALNTVNALRKFQTSIYTAPLDMLLSDSTDNDPSKRPNMKQFSSQLKTWISLNYDYSKRNPIEWQAVQKKLFPLALPKRVVWENNDDIISILNYLGETDNLNHMLFASGGGMDLKGAKNSVEADCIELNCQGIAYIVKSKRLFFESFDSESEWNYFRLETEGLKPSGVYDYIYNPFHIEELVEISSGEYVDRKHWDMNEYSEKPLPKYARLLLRVLDGDLVIFQKTSTYNSIPETYDGRHGKMTADKFRIYIQRLIECFSKSKGKK